MHRSDRDQPFEDKDKDMYKSVLVGRAKGGKAREAIAAVKKVAEYAKSKHGIQLDVYVQQFGPVGTIYAMADSRAVTGQPPGCAPRRPTVLVFLGVRLRPR